MAKGKGEPVFIVKLAKGLADRKRLPLGHVISVLEEIRQMIAEVGKEFQRQKGSPDPSGDFGLELIAGASGIAFKPGSVQANIAITQHAETGIMVAKEVVRTINVLDSEDFASAVADQQINPSIIRRLNRIGRIQRFDKTEMRLSLRQPGTSKRVAATFGAAAIAAAHSLQASTFKVEGFTVYGKLYELIDRVQSDNVEDKGFWGELLRDNGEVWRVLFKPEDVQKATQLFRKQIWITGVAVYYRVANPKMITETFGVDTERDLERAFDDLYGCNKKIYNADFATLLKRMHGEE